MTAQDDPIRDTIDAAYLEVYGRAALDYADEHASTAREMDRRHHGFRSGYRAGLARAEDERRDVPRPVGRCPKCGSAWYSLEGFCGGCV